MPRRRGVAERQAVADVKYGDLTLAKFIDGVMRKGKKSVAEHIVYGALDIVGEKTGESPLEVFKKALKNARPLVQVKARRVGGATYQVPVEVGARKGQSLGMRAIIQCARDNRGKNMCEALAQEILDCSRNQGTAVKKKEDMHRMAAANKAFSHYRW